MKLLSFLLIVMILAPAFATPTPVVCVKVGGTAFCVSKCQAHKCGGCNKTKKETKDTKEPKNTGGPFCNYCILCMAFILPIKPALQKDFATSITKYTELAQTKLSDYNPSCWRPPNA